jgi:hypothetical protein
MIISQTRYGAYEHGTPYYREKTWRRRDTYRSEHKDLDGNVDSFAAAGRDDQSPVYQGPYNAKCPCCWLAHGHTTEYHKLHTPAQ